MSSLRHDEAMARASVIGDIRAEVDLDLGTGETFTSRTRLVFEATQGASSFVDCGGSDVTAVLNGRTLPEDALQDGLLLVHDLLAENVLEVSATMRYADDGEALHRHDDPSDGATYLYAMSFLDAAPRWFACFDQPDLKATYRFTVTTPDDSWIVRGNAPVVEHEGRRWRLDWTPPLSTYFVTLVAGPWASVETEHDGIRLELLARASLRAELERSAEDVLAVTADSFDAYHQLFDVRYPFGDYVQAFVPDFNAGAMENPGCIVIREQVLFRGAATQAEVLSRAGLIAHEMAHQWFGDLVTMRWWDDLWLNESFAEYMAHRVISGTGRADLWVDFGITRKNWGSEADQGPGSHPIAGNGAEDAQTSLQNFDGISYAKGASVLRQLVAWLGDDAFLAGLRTYFARHRFGNAGARDLLDCWAEASGKDVEAWAQQWLTTQGMDLLEVRDGQVVRIVPAEHPARREHSIEVTGFDREGRQLSSERVLLGDQPVTVTPAPVLVPDAADETWARVRPSVPLADLPVLSAFPRAATRVVLVNALRDGVRNGELRAAQALHQVLAALPGEQDATLGAAMLRWALDLSGVWTAVEGRADARGRVAATAQDLVRERRGDMQLAAARTWLASTTEAPELERWLDGGGLPEGINMDQELRWQVVHRLVMLGGDPALVDEEYERDHTSSGLVAARRARTARPSAEAKQAALDELVNGSLGNYELYAIAENLFLPEQAHLTEGLVGAWCEGMVQAAGRRQGWVVPRIVQFSVPASHSTPATREALAGVLARPDLPAVIERPVAEALRRVEQVMLAAQ